MSWPTTLETKRLVLRPWRMSDAEALFEYACDPDVGPAAGWLPHASVDESRKALKKFLMVPETYAVTIRDAEDPDRPAGSVSLKVGIHSDLAIGDDQAELTYWLGKPLWGQGLMPEAVRAVMRHAFIDLGLVAIWAGRISGHKQNRRVQEKLGLNHQRFIRNRPRQIVGDYITENVNWITRDEWEVLQKADPTDDASVSAQQDEADKIIASTRKIARIRSGGQTGADRAALDAARELNIPICGWVPAGGLAEDMPEAPGLLARYPELQESPSQSYVERTALNVRDAHATLVVAPSGLEPCSGTQMTVRFAEAMCRPCLVIRGVEEVGAVRKWLEGLGMELTLNIAGPRESKAPGTYEITKQVVNTLLKSLA